MSPHMTFFIIYASFGRKLKRENIEREGKQEGCSKESLGGVPDVHQASGSSRDGDRSGCIDLTKLPYIKHSTRLDVDDRQPAFDVSQSEERREVKGQQNNREGRLMIRGWPGCPHEANTHTHTKQ